MVNSSIQDEHSSKRRKVRKGTQSCWECKKRKVRCIFPQRNSTVCDNCTRRGNACISQDLPDKVPPLVNSSQGSIEARLGRVEELVEQLINNVTQVSGHGNIADNEDENLHKRMSVTRRIEGQNDGLTPTLHTRAFPVIQEARSERRIPSEQDEIALGLIAAWPSESELDLICSLPAGLSTHLRCGACIPYSGFMDSDSLSLRDMFRLPCPGIHPVLSARKLLVLGTYLQGVSSSVIRDSGGLGKSYLDIMSRVVDRATKLVTTNEELIGSVEGVECVLLEAMYHNYAGNLHRAWMATRRAITAAQMMMLHRGLKSTALKFIDSKTRTNSQLETLCLRLVEMDCYLSLMLGLPPASLESTFASPRALENCDPIEQMQRIHCAVSVQILQSDADVKSIEKAYEIDRKLQKAAAEVPPHSWLVPDFALGKDDSSALYCDTVRVMDQFTHYHLLIRLHLPYMLRSSTDSRYDHSKVIAINASREILARYTVFRTSNPAHFYCRGTDFLAFIAITVICLAHIDSHGRELRRTTEANPILAFNFLAHSRPGDRGMMERTLEIVESMASFGTDPIASKLGYIIRHLLIVESSAANGTLYMTSSSKGDEEDTECHVKVTEDGQVLRVHIPYFGTIHFDGGSISKTSLMAPKHAPSDVPREAALPQSQPMVNEASALHTNGVELDSAGLQDDWDLGIDMAFFDSLFRGIEVPEHADGGTWESWEMDDLNNAL